MLICRGSLLYADCKISYDPLRRGGMRAAEAKELVLGRMLGGHRPDDGMSLVHPGSPDGDPAKFLIAGKIARAIHHFDGWYVPINLSWFAGSYDQPVINRTPFYWYVFAIPARRRYRADHYVICDYLQVRDWVLAFAAPLGKDHRDHKLWRGACDCTRTSELATSDGEMSPPAATTSPAASSTWTTSAPSGHLSRRASMSADSGLAESPQRTGCSNSMLQIIRLSSA